MSFARRLAPILATAVVAIAAAALPAPAQATHYKHLLAPSSVCPKQGVERLKIRRARRVMHCMHNFARRKVGSPRVSRHAMLQRSARAKSKDILDCQNFSHTACGRDAFYWVRYFGFLTSGCYSLGENIAYGSGRNRTVRSRMSAWLHSDGHRRSLLRRDFRRIGLGLARGKYKGYKVDVWTAHFGVLC